MIRPNNVKHQKISYAVSGCHPLTRQAMRLPYNNLAAFDASASASSAL
jgi:hypothetical protein